MRTNAFIITVLATVAGFMPGALFPTVTAARHEPLSIDARLSHPCLQYGSDGEMYYYLTLTGDDIGQVRRLPMNLSLVIDRSGSMAAQDKLGYAKSAAHSLVDQMQSGDFLSIVSYDDRIRVLIPSTRCSDKYRFHQVIDSLYSGNATNLCGGMLAGYEEVLKQFDTERLNRVILLSDGLANTGISDPRQIWQRAAECRRRGVSITTMGVGVDYDERLMTNIAEHSGGNYHYISNPEAMTPILLAELHELGRIIGRDVVITIELGEGVRVADIYGYNYEQQGNRITIRVSDVYAGEQRKLVLRLQVPTTGRDQFDVAASQIAYRGAADQRSYTSESPQLNVKLTASRSEVEKNCDKDVLAKAEMVNNAQAMQTAIDYLKAGKRELAETFLSGRVKASVAANAAILDENKEVAEQLGEMQGIIEEMEATEGDHTARRDLEIRTSKQALDTMQ